MNANNTNNVNSLTDINNNNQKQINIDSVVKNNELLTIIFDFLETKKELSNIRLVCRQWRKSCKRFFKQVKFIGSAVLNPDEIPSTLNQDFIKEREAILEHYSGNFEFVEEFECYGWSNQKVMNFFAANFPNIMTLHLRSVVDLDGSINNSDSLFPNLSHLTVENVSIGTLPANVLFQSPIKNLKTLDLIHMTDSEKYPKVFGFARQLLELNISFMAYNPSVVSGIALYLHKLKKLTLILHWVNDTDSPHGVFQNCSQLEDIVLSLDCNLAKSLYYIANNNPLSKKSLVLMDNNHLHIPSLITVFESCHNLTQIEFQNCPTLTIEALEAISTNLPNLEAFKVEQPYLPIEWVALVLQKFGNLRYLHLTALPPISLKLPALWPSSAHLKTLYFRGIQFLPPFDLVSLNFPNLDKCEINDKKLL